MASARVQMDKPTRRTIIIAASFFMSVLARSSFRVPGGMQKTETSAEDLVQIFESCRSSAEALGREHLRRVPNEADATKLVSLICSGFSKSPPIGRDHRAIREWIRARSRDDFKASRVVEIQGWILSATEARLCALAALS